MSFELARGKGHRSVLEHLEPCDLQVLRLQLPSVELLVYDSDGRRVPS